MKNKSSLILIRCWNVSWLLPLAMLNIACYLADITKGIICITNFQVMSQWKNILRIILFLIWLAWHTKDRQTSFIWWMENLWPTHLKTTPPPAFLARFIKFWEFTVFRALTLPNKSSFFHICCFCRAKHLPQYF